MFYLLLIINTSFHTELRSFFQHMGIELRMISHILRNGVTIISMKNASVHALKSHYSKDQRTVEIRIYIYVSISRVYFCLKLSMAFISLRVRIT